MQVKRRARFVGLIAIVLSAGPLSSGVTIPIETAMAPPGWALLERELLKAQTEACKLYFDRYFDERGYLLALERWGGLDGPDDALECLRDWPVLHALGAPDSILRMYKKGLEGHLRQFTEAKTTEVEFARDGMYYKEFPVMMDWAHTGEGLAAFNVQGLSDPYDRRFRQRVRRFAGFYMNEDPGAPNYDPRHKIIRSMFNGSRGPLLRKTTPLDWAGDPIQIKDRFKPRHGESTYQDMLDHFEDYTDVVGDHPLNLLSTTLALNAYMLEHESKYKRWLLEYVDAWLQRMKANGGIIPSNVGLDGTIGGAAGGKWYGGTYGWAASFRTPGTDVLAHRNLHRYGLVGFVNAFLLTGDPKYLTPWREQMDKVNAQAKVINGQKMYPAMYGDEGWYHFTPRKYDPGALDRYYFLMDPQDLERLPRVDWIDYLLGKNPGYPEAALRADFDIVRRKVEAIRSDPTTPDTPACRRPDGLQSRHRREAHATHAGGLALRDPDSRVLHRADIQHGPVFGAEPPEHSTPNRSPRNSASLPATLLRSRETAGRDTARRGGACGQAHCR